MSICKVRKYQVPFIKKNYNVLIKIFSALQRLFVVIIKRKKQWKNGAVILINSIHRYF